MVQLKPNILNQLSRFICGDDYEYFVYRSSSKLTDFFQEIGLNYHHDGSTRRYWVTNVLTEINGTSEIDNVIKNLLDFSNFTDFNDANTRHCQAIDKVNQILKSENLEIIRDKKTNTVTLSNTTINFISTSTSPEKVSKVVTFSPSVFKIPDTHLVNNCVAVMMPFNMEFDKVYETIKKACSNLDMTYRRADDFWKDSVIIQDIFELICRSSIVIVDFSGKNENVFYEAGIAHTLGKNVIPITQNLNDIPFDLRHHRHLVYLSNGEGLEDLRNGLEARLKVLKNGK